jgi:hypothetical protein
LFANIEGKGNSGEGDYVKKIDLTLLPVLLVILRMLFEKIFSRLGLSIYL